MFGLRNNKEEALISLLIKNKGIGKDYSKIINEYLKSKLGEHIDVPTEIKKSELDSNDTFYINKSNSIYKYLIHGDNNGIKQINRKDMNKLLYYMLTVDTYAKEIENSSFFFDYSIQEINEVLNDCIDTTSTTPKDYDNFKDLIEYFSPKTNFGACTLDFDKTIGLSIRKLKNQYEGIVENDQVLSSNNNESESKKFNIKDFTTSIQTKYNELLTELNDLKQKYETLSSTTNQSESDEIDIKDYITTIEKKYDAILEELNHLQQKDKDLSSNATNTETDVKGFITSVEKKYDAIFRELNQLRQKGEIISHAKDKTILENEFIQFESISNEKEDYPEVRYIDKFFRKNKYSLIRFFRRFLPIRNEKRYYKDVAINSKFGNKKVIAQMMQYYIPATYNITGEEDDITFKKLNQNNIDLDINPIDKNENNLIDELWQKAIIEENAPTYFFVLAGTGRGKTSFIIKLYLKYLMYSHKFKIPKLLIATKFDKDFDNQLKAILYKCNFHLKKFPSTKIILLIDALDEDIMINDIHNFKNRLYELSERLSFFDSVVITSRKQLFPTNLEVEKIKYYMPSSLFYYINPFSEAEINLYIDKKYSKLPKKEQYKRTYAKEYVDKYKFFLSSQMLLSFMDYLVTEKYRHYFKSKEELYHHIVTQWIRREAKSVKRRFFQNDYDKILEKYSNRVAKNFYEEQVFGVSKTNLEVFQDEIKGFGVHSRSILYSTSQGYYFFAHKIFLDYFIANALINDISFDEIFISSSLYKDVEDIYNYLAWKKVIEPIRIEDSECLKFRYKGEENEKTTEYFRYQDIPKVNYVKYIPSYKNAPELRDVLRIFKNISLLDLSQQNIISLPAFKGFNDLRVLKLNQNPNIDISTISSFNTVLNLEINNCNLKDISPIISLSKLEILSLDDNDISDISDISKLVNLQTISIQENKIENIESLFEMSKLKVVLLKRNPINSQLAFFRSCSNLNHLEFSLFPNSDNVLNNLEQIKHINNLEIDALIDGLIPKHIIELKKIFKNINTLSFCGIKLSGHELKLFLHEGILSLYERTNIDNLDLRSLESIHTFLNNITIENRLQFKFSNWGYNVLPKAAFGVQILRERKQAGIESTTFNMSEHIIDPNEFLYYSSYKWEMLFLNGIVKNLSTSFIERFTGLKEIVFNCLPILYVFDSQARLGFDENIFQNLSLKKFTINGWLLNNLDMANIQWVSNLFEEIEIKSISNNQTITNWRELLRGRFVKVLNLINIQPTIFIKQLDSEYSTIKELKIENSLIDNFVNIFSFLNLRKLYIHNVSEKSNFRNRYLKHTYVNGVLNNLVELSLDLKEHSFFSNIDYTQLYNLKKLTLKNLSITNLKIISKHLEELSLVEIEISDYSFLENKNELSTLSIIRQNLDTLRFISNLKLKKLTINWSLLTELDNLEKMQSLEDLNLSFNEINDFTSISKLHNLKRLELSSNQISDISFLSPLKNLEFLKISSNKILDITPLKNLKSLKELYIQGNPITEYKETIEELCKYNLTLLFVSDKATSSISLKSDEWNPVYIKRRIVLTDYPEIPFSCNLVPVAIPTLYDEEGNPIE